MRVKRFLQPVKLNPSQIKARCWSYTPVQGTLDGTVISVSGNFALAIENSSRISAQLHPEDDGERTEKRLCVFPKYRLVYLKTATCESAHCIGSFKFQTDHDVADEQRNTDFFSCRTFALRFDPAYPSRTLFLRVSLKSGVVTNSYSCSIIWSDIFGAVNSRTFDADDLLVDLANAGRLIACTVHFIDASRGIVFVNLTEIEQQFAPERDVVPRKSDAAVGYLLRYFHGINTLFEPHGTGHGMMDNQLDWLKLFANIKTTLLSSIANFNGFRSRIDLTLLATKLRPYQLEAVRWMLWRENIPYPHEQSLFHSFFSQMISVLSLTNNSACFVNRVSCRPFLEMPLEMKVPTGGVLADEMGLGKTLEVIALILSNPRSTVAEQLRVPNSMHDSVKAISSDFYFSCICGNVLDDSELVTCFDCGCVQHSKCVGWIKPYSGPVYYCPYCIFNHDVIESRATLIVTPSTICTQWAEEISRHVKLSSLPEASLKVFTYYGVKMSGVYIQPKSLADNDVVLVSYETLKSELANANLQFQDRSGSFRTVKRFMAVPSPLTAIRWWRLCIDEAQMVESPTNAAQMVRRLQSVHRWCITGTPITRSVNDLFGLLIFLRYPLFSTPLYFNQLIAKPYFDGNSGPLVTLFSSMFWRTSKHSVLDQIGVPFPSESTTYLTFSPVEEHVYRNHYNTNKLSWAISELGRFDRQMLIRQLDRRVVDRFFDPMTPLRRACSDLGKRYQAGLQRHNTDGIRIQMPATMTMDQVLKDLVHRAKTICTDYNRQYICCLNGLAGLNVLRKNLKEAVDLFRQVLWFARNNSEEICETDKLQLIHATHNLHEVLQIAKSNGDKTVDEAPGDCSLPQRESELVSAFVGKVFSRIQENKNAVSKFENEILRIDSEFYEDWWAEICECLLKKLSDEDMCDFFLRLQNNLRDTCASSHLMLTNQVNTPNAFMLAMVKRLEAIDNLRQSWRDAVFVGVTKTPLTELSQQLSACSCCTQLQTPANSKSSHCAAAKASCAFCKSMKSCVEYEKALFSARKNINEDSAGVSTDDVWAWSDSEAERALKFLLSFAKRNSRLVDLSKSEIGLKELFESGDKHIERFRSLKGEFRNLRQLWMSLKDRAGAELELAMASNRFRLIEDALDNQQKTIGTAFVSAAEIPNLILDNERNAEMAKFNFEKACGQLRYLQSLEKTVSNKTGASLNDENCPVCMSRLGTSWAVLPCAHCVCLACVTTIRSMVLHNRRLPCPVCRQTLEPHELAYVSLRSVDEVFPEENIDINGNYSTKFMAVVKIIKVVLLRDPTAKFLVFSSWSDVLHNLVNVLRENQISALFLQKGGSHKSRQTSGAPTRDNFTTTLRRFRCSGKEGDSTGTVSTLLLPYSSGANGLNLTEANHVILMDPCLTHSMDAQAIARVYRIGQTRETTVHRLFVRSTIEERIYSVLLKKRAKHQHNELEELADNDTNDADSDDGFMEDAVVGDLLDLYHCELEHGLKSSNNSNAVNLDA